MSSIVTLTPEQDKLLLAARQREYHKTPTSPFSFIRQWAEIGSDAGAINSIAKLVKSILSIAVAFVPSEPLKNSIKFTSGLSDGLKVAGAGKGINDIKENSNKPLKVASATLGLTSTVAAGVKIGHTVGAIDLGKANLLIGNIPVIGTYAARFFPILTLFNIVDIIKAGLDIKLQSDKIRQFNQTDKKIHTKIAKWIETGKSEENCKKALAEKKVTIQAKTKKAQEVHEASVKKLTAAAAELANAEKALEAAKDTREKARFFAKIKAFYQHRKALHQFNTKWTAHTNLSAVASHNQARVDRLASREKGLDEPKIDSKLYAEKKVEKWQIKQGNNRVNKIKEGLGIALNSVLMVTLVGLSVLGGFALLSILPISLSISSGFLAVSLLGLGIHFLNKLWKPTPYKPVPVSSFITNA